MKHLPLVIALGLVLGSALVVAPAWADEPTRMPDDDPDAYPAPRVKGQVALAGLGLTLGFYGASLGMSYLYPDAPGAESLRVPVAGPWLALADTGCPANDPDCPTVLVVFRAILTTLDGIAQVGGLGIAAEAAFVPTRQPAREAPAAALRRAPAPARRGVRVRAMPFATDTTVGLGFVGRF